MENHKSEKILKVPDACPHCGHRLSPWQQVLLNVDKILTCKNCWYKIIYDPLGNSDNKKKPGESKNEAGK